MVSLQQKKGTYYAVFRIPDGDGGTKQKWVSTKIQAKRGNKREALKVAEEIANRYEQSKIVAYPKTPFWEWIDMWIEQKQYEVDQITIEGYKSYIKNHIKPYFQQHSVNLNDLSPQDLQAYYNSKTRRPGEKKKGKLSGKSLRAHHAIIHGALEDAVKKNIIPYNPADRVTLPKKERYVGKFYTKEQIAELLKAVRGTSIADIVLMTVLYGLRRSEVVGIKWPSVDFEHNAFTIQSTVVRFSELIEKDKTKNKASRRSYPLTPEVKQMLMFRKERQERMKGLFGSAYHDSQYVFTWEDGRPLQPDYVTHKFSKILETNGLPHIRFHDLRHTTASLLLSEGYDLKRISEWLGHSDISTTADIYGHLSFETKKDTMGTMERLIAGDKKTSC